MEVKNQIRAYRSGLGMSQEELAEAVYVTRQTVSNWETGKSYPDIQSLLRLSALFGISLDQLIKGDVKQMKEKINAEEIRAFNRLSNVFTLMMVLSLLVWAPLAYFLGWWGIALAAVLFAFTLWLAFRVEKEKKKYDIQSYKEIVAFLEGRRLDEISKAQEVAKRPCQKVLLTLGSAALAAVVSAGLFWLLPLFFEKSIVFIKIL